MAAGDRLDDYHYDLPDGAIALRPANPRDSARLLCATGGALSDHTVADLPSILRPGDRLVVNDSKVVPARLVGTRGRGAAVAGVELLLLAELSPNRWSAFAKPAKKMQPGDRLRFGDVEAEVEERDGAVITARFLQNPLTAGAMPLPPYIAAQREPDAQDFSDYQTVYADPAGSVAAPTAGLHFTEVLLTKLADMGVATTRVTLHVGAGTFLPVKDDIDSHVMHAEWGSVSGAAAAEMIATKNNGGRLVAVGTTALRLMETAARSGTIAPFTGDTTLFIRPGFTFHAADLLLTNFHLPRSTLLMLVAAFTGYERMRAIYDHALKGGYRFYSYGDASLLERAR